MIDSAFRTAFLERLADILGDPFALEKAQRTFQKNYAYTEIFICKDNFGISRWDDNAVKALSGAVYMALDGCMTADSQRMGAAVKRTLIAELTRGIEPSESPLEAFRNKVFDLIGRQAPKPAQTRCNMHFFKPIIAISAATILAATAFGMDAFSPRQ